MIQTLHELRVTIKDDPKRAAVLFALAGVLVLVGVRAFVFSGGPRSAAASDHSGGLAATSSQAVASGASLAASVVEKSRGEIVVLPPPPLSLRNVFQIDPALFPPPDSNKPDGTQPKVAEKSASAIAENPEEAARNAMQQLELRIAKESEGLRLRGTLLGGSPTAVLETVSDRKSFVLMPAQQIIGFTLVEVRPTSVVLEKEGITVELHRAGSEPG